MKKGVKLINLIFAFFMFLFCFILNPIGLVNADEVFTVYVNGKKYCLYSPEIGYGLNGVYINDLNGFCERIYQDTLIPAKNASLNFLALPEKPFSFQSEKWGKHLPISSIKTQISRAILMGKTKVYLSTQPLKPEISVGVLRSQTELRATFSTYYGASSENRKHNVELCAKSINASIIKQGEIFSFNQKTGERSEENGYKSAKVILDGEFVEGVGGGVCQVSSTLYNAVLKAGLEVTEWHRHSLPVSYVEPSFDAMVSSYSDLKIKNVTNSAVYVTAHGNGEMLTVKVYGLKNDCDYMLKSCVTEIIQAKTLQVKNSEGLTLTEKPAKNGYKSEGYLCVYKNGKLLFNRKLREDLYNAVNGVEIIE